MTVTPETVLTFWFEELEEKDHFRKSDELDNTIRERFLTTHQAVMAGETSHWRESPDGRFAEIIVLDQFSRNMFRDTAEAFASDPLALALAQEMVRQGDDKAIAEDRRQFAYMPYMHSESSKVHEESLPLFKPYPGSYEFELKHKAIIDRFGRYPYRNPIVGRESTAEELEWMETNSGF